MSTVPTVPKQKRQYTWSYGIIAVCRDGRPDNELCKTIASLKESGFGTPKLFVDGISHLGARELEDRWHLPVTSHANIIRPFGNWILGLWELWLYNPTTDYYAMFQDDIIACKNLREYIEENPFPRQGYANLLTVPANEKKILETNPITTKCDICIGSGLERTPFHPDYKTCSRCKGLGELPDSNVAIGWHESNQMGLGAQALVFSRTTTLHLLSSRVMVEKPWLAGHKAWKNIDGSIVVAMNGTGYREYIHYPSLVQHIGEKSTIGNNNLFYSDCFWGEYYDAMKLIRK